MFNWNQLVYWYWIDILLYHHIWTEEFIKAKLEYENCRAKQIVMNILKKYFKRTHLSWSQTTESDIDTRMINMRKFHTRKLVGKCKEIDEYSKESGGNSFVIPQKYWRNQRFLKNKEKINTTYTKGAEENTYWREKKEKKGGKKIQK